MGGSWADGIRKTFLYKTAASYHMTFGFQRD